MRGILDQIVRQKAAEIAERKLAVPLAVLKEKNQLAREPLSLSSSILNGSGVIAEFKRASPSKGIIRSNANASEIARAYVNAGASGVSVLTDKSFFKGSEEDLMNSRAVIDKPILRKDFTIDVYQVYEAKSIGADCILLIAAILSKEQLRELHSLAEGLGLEILVEIHEERELDKLPSGAKLIGINNRNLDTFKVDIANSIRLAGQLPDVVRVAESGLGNNSNLQELRAAGFHGFLVGESFMREPDPGSACRSFIHQLSV
jgi:indole-3-glycerol phosphate synthase